MKKQTTTMMIGIRRGSGEKIKPHSDTANYHAFVESEKEKGLQRKYWKDLPGMWKKTLEFRTQLERALNDFAKP